MDKVITATAEKEMGMFSQSTLTTNIRVMGEAMEEEGEDTTKGEGEDEEEREDLTEVEEEEEGVWEEEEEATEGLIKAMERMVRFISM